MPLLVTLPVSAVTYGLYRDYDLLNNWLHSRNGFVFQPHLKDAESRYFQMDVHFIISPFTNLEKSIFFSKLNEHLHRV